jgi:3-oxoacyl-[acyl-carrier protein] reductase
MALESRTVEELRGRVALVTGVGRRAGIGAAIARELSAAGADVLISYLHAYDAAQPWGADPDMPGALLAELRQSAKAEARVFDLTQPDAPELLFGAAVECFGRVDILVNNAAHWEAGGADRIDAAQLDRHYAVNTRAPVLLCVELARRHPRGLPGRIINISSGQSRSAMPGELAYAVSKAALDVLTTTLAAECCAYNRAPCRERRTSSVDARWLQALPA